MLRELRSAFLVLLALTIVTGVAYPLAVTGLAQLLFPEQANGSLLRVQGRPAGSALIGQSFDDPRYFWSRPSATGRFPYDASASSGSNLGPTNDALVEALRGRVAALRASDPENAAPIPVDLVTTSASGLDPDLSPAAAAWQVGRVARVRGLPREKLEALIRQHTEGRWLGLLGEPRVHVLALNLALDAASPQ
jgi:K+-transporting ATPase ATPase C chain